MMQGYYLRRKDLRCFMNFHFLNPTVFSSSVTYVAAFAFNSHMFLWCIPLFCTNPYLYFIVIFSIKFTQIFYLKKKAFVYTTFLKKSLISCGHTLSLHYLLLNLDSRKKKKLRRKLCNVLWWTCTDGQCCIFTSTIKVKTAGRAK